MAETLDPPISTDKMRMSRIRAGLSQTALARRCVDMGYRISQQQVNKIERGESGTSPATLKALADAMDVEVDDLLEPA